MYSCDVLYIFARLHSVGSWTIVRPKASVVTLGQSHTSRYANVCPAPDRFIRRNSRATQFLLTTWRRVRMVKTKKEKKKREDARAVRTRMRRYFSAWWQYVVSVALSARVARVALTSQKTKRRRKEKKKTKRTGCSKSKHRRNKPSSETVEFLARKSIATK